MRYEAPYCPWCPGSIRAWREGQPFGHLSSVADPRPDFEIPRQPTLGTHITPPRVYDECLSRRIAEIVRFAKSKGYRKIGVAACEGSEALVELLCTTLANAGLEVISAASEFAASQSEPWLPSLALTEAVGCNPEAQAKRLDAEGCDLNVAAGLCVGCDSIFFRHAEAPTTVLASPSSQALVSEGARAEYA